MNFFTFTNFGRSVLLAVLLTIGAASAEEALFYNTSGGAGAGNLTRLGYDGNVLKQRNDVASDGGASEHGAPPDFYFALKFFDITNHGTIGLNGDFVFIKHDGTYQGADIDIGIGIPKISSDSVNMSFDVGVGYSFGRELCLPGNLQILLGGSIGLWMGGKVVADDDSMNVAIYYNIVGPSVRVHWYSVELMYRMLLGFGMNVKDSNVSGEEMKMSSGVTHRVSIGYCFGKNPK